MSRRDKIITIIIAIVLSAILIKLSWRDTNGEVVRTTSYAVQNTPYLVATKSPPDREVVVASWYDYDLDKAPEYSTYTATAASRDYPRETWLQVWTDEKIVVVRVNDWVENPNVAIDLSSFAFQQLAPLSKGLAKVRIQPLLVTVK